MEFVAVSAVLIGIGLLLIWNLAPKSTGAGAVTVLDSNAITKIADDKN